MLFFENGDVVFKFSPLLKKRQARNQENFMDGGLPFPSPKIVQNEHFYIILLTEKVAVTLSPVLG